MKFKHKILKKWRSDQKISQAIAAKHIGIAQPYYNSLERGLAIPSLGKTLPLISKALSIREFDLLEPEVEINPTKAQATL